MAVNICSSSIARWIPLLSIIMACLFLCPSASLVVSFYLHVLSNTLCMKTRLHLCPMAQYSNLLDLELLVIYFYGPFSESDMLAIRTHDLHVKSPVHLFACS